MQQPYTNTNGIINSILTNIIFSSMTQIMNFDVVCYQNHRNSNKHPKLGLRTRFYVNPAISPLDYIGSGLKICTTSLLFQKGLFLKFLGA